MTGYRLVAAAAIALAATSAQAADIGYGDRPSDRYRSAYEDPRYRDIYGAPDRRAQPHYRHRDQYAQHGTPRSGYPSAPPAGYGADDEAAPAENGYGQQGDGDQGNGSQGYGGHGYGSRGYGQVPEDPKSFAPPPRHYGHAAPRPLHPPVAYHGHCTPREEVRYRLTSQGWHSFREIELRPRVAIVEARRPRGFPYLLHIDRCSGEILKARPAGGRPYHAHPYHFAPRPYVVMPRPHVSFILR